MKTQPHRINGSHRNASRPSSIRSPRYPSLYEDFEPLFPSKRRSQRPVEISNWSRISPIRVFSALAIIVIIATLMATA